MRDSFGLTLRALVRGHVLTLLLAAVALVHVLFPSIVRADNTVAGWREMFIRAVPGFVVAVVLVVTLACACGFFSRERETNRLALTVVRPASAFSVAVGRWLALCCVAMVALTMNAALTFARLPDAPGCRHHVAPILPPAATVAREMMEEYRVCTALLSGHRGLLLRSYFFNLLQRTSQILVTVCCFLALGGRGRLAGDIFAMQSFAVIGSNCVPVPGAMGVVDYLMLDGFGAFLSPSSASSNPF